MLKRLWNSTTTWGVLIFVEGMAAGVIVCLGIVVFLVIT